MAISAANVISPVLASSKIVVLFSTGMTTKTGLRDFFRRSVLERNDLRWISLFEVSFAWSMTGLTASYFSLPATEFSEVEMRSMGKRFELIFVAVFARVATDVTRVRLTCDNKARVAAGFGRSG